MSKPIPCTDCITLPMCKNRIKNNIDKKTSDPQPYEKKDSIVKCTTIVEYKKHCSLLKKHLNEMRTNDYYPHIVNIYMFMVS